MGKIKILEPEVAQKIAAGEVIERPFSVVKELVENSLDAGATEIRVELVDGGKKLIKVVDNGSGLSQEDVFLCFERHATSKISRAEDLERIATLGFRGEALASIDAVSRLVLKTSEGTGGIKVEREGGRLLRFSEGAYPRGTSIEVRDLFFNLPVRRKFLRSAQSELALIARYLTLVALAFPEISFSLSHGGRQLVNCPGVKTRKERFYQLFGRQALERMLEPDLKEGDYQITGFLSRPPRGSPDKQRQVYYVNCRPVRDRTLAAAVQQATKGWYEKDSYPEIYLFLTLPCSEVDVNVHPAKAEVRFRDSLRVFQLAVTSIDEALKRESRAKAVYFEQKFFELKDVKTMEIREEGLKRRPLFPEERGMIDFEKKTPLSPQEKEIGDRSRLTTEEGRKEEARDTSWKVLGQYLNFYIIVSDKEGLLIIDQHNAHERVLYEKYLALDRQRGFIRRQSLFPLILELSPAEMVRFEENKALLEEFGFELENLGGRSLLLRSFPDFLEDEEARQIFLAFLGEAESVPSPELRPRFLATMACKTAVKAGVALTPEKMEYLVSELFECEHPWLCPHGRPTALRLSLEDIEKGLKRS